MKIQRLQPDIDLKTTWTPYDELAYRLEEHVGETVLISDLPLLIAVSTDEMIESEIGKRGVKVKIVSVQDARTPSWIKVKVIEVR